jgi:hypothetical protein
MTIWQAALDYLRAYADEHPVSLFEMFPMLADPEAGTRTYRRDLDVDGEQISVMLTLIVTGERNIRILSMRGRGGYEVPQLTARKIVDHVFGGHAGVQKMQTRSPLTKYVRFEPCPK